jgi:hypothetical protein
VDFDSPTTLDTSWKAVRSVTLTLPSPGIGGYAVVSASGTFDSGSGISNHQAECSLGESSANSAYSVGVELENNEEHPFALVRGFRCSAGGRSYTFRVFCRLTDPLDSVTMEDVQMTVVFSPARY